MADFDRIVFCQKELDKALDDGVIKIALCDNSFILPMIKNITYYGFGEIRAVIEKEYREYGIKCFGFAPHVKERHRYPAFLMSSDILGLNTKSLSESGGSYYGAYGSYSGSYMTSYRMSSGSMTSFKALYLMSGSYRSSGGSYIFRGSFSSGGIYVGGYGINLI